MKELDCKTCPMKRLEAWFMRYLLDPMDLCSICKIRKQNGGDERG